MPDGQDFEKLVGDYYQSLYQFAYSLTRDESGACDLVQQTYCVWAVKGGQLRDGSKVKSWLFTTLYREFLGSLRRQTRFPHLDLESAQAELPVVEPGASSRLDTDRLLAVLAGLDEAHQAPVALFYLQDYSYKEIAEILEVPLGTVKSRLARGLERLHGMLEGNQTRKTQKSINPGS